MPLWRADSEPGLVAFSVDPARSVSGPGRDGARFAQSRPRRLQRLGRRLQHGTGVRRPSGFMQGGCMCVRAWMSVRACVRMLACLCDVCVCERHVPLVDRS
jgi:hypothetical protein